MRSSLPQLGTEAVTLGLTWLNLTPVGNMLCMSVYLSMPEVLDGEQCNQLDLTWWLFAVLRKHTHLCMYPPGGTRVLDGEQHDSTMACKPQHVWHGWCGVSNVHISSTRVCCF